MYDMVQTLVITSKINIANKAHVIATNITKKDCHQLTRPSGSMYKNQSCEKHAKNAQGLFPVQY